MIYEVEIPLPPRSCSSNRRGYWGGHVSARAQYRGDCATIFRHSFKEPFVGRITVHAGFYLGKIPLERQGVRADIYRPKDVDNAVAALKSVFDAMVDACIVPDDNADHVVLGGVRLYRTAAEHGGRCCVVLRIETEEDD